MRIIKVFNQNAVLVKDQGEDKIVTGKGIGFSRKKNEIVPAHMVERIYVQNENKEKMHHLLEYIQPEYFIASEEIISEAELVLKTQFNDHIHLLLADHIAFAVERLRDGIVMKNKLLTEIQVMYPKEFSIAEWSINFLREKFHLDFPLDEAGYIAIHFHSANLGKTSRDKSLREITIVSRMVELISQGLDIDFSQMQNSLDYSRLVLHLRYVVERVYESKLHTMDEEVLEILKIKYKNSFELAKEVISQVAKDYYLVIPEQEVGYITLHIERLSSQVRKRMEK